MSKRRKVTCNDMVSTNKKKVPSLSCSTPEPPVDSPSCDSDATYDSDSASPVPFICTQDGTEGETDVVWNFYTPNSKFKNTTPLSRHRKRCIRPRAIEKPLPKRRTVKNTQKKNELFQELFELKQNLHEYLSKKPTHNSEKPQSEEDMFSDTSDNSVKNGLRTSSRCLRKNILNSKYKIESDTGGLESDDSINDCLIKVSQMVEENVMPVSKKPDVKSLFNKETKHNKLTIDNDSMDAILSNKLDSPSLNKFIKYNSPKFNNDSFDNLLGDLNESALERLSQMPVNHASAVRTPVSTKTNTSWMLKEFVVNNGSPTTSSPFSRYNSMPESPTINTKPSTSGTAFTRYKSMPFNKSVNQDDSPIKCTPDEIKKKHQQAREKLIAKRMLPFTTNLSHQAGQLSSQVKQNDETNHRKKKGFQPKVPSSNSIPPVQNMRENHIKSIIEQKRQEALMKLRKRHQKNTKSYL